MNLKTVIIEQEGTEKKGERTCCAHTISHLLDEVDGL